MTIGRRLEPEIVTKVPPSAVPLFGVIDETTGVLESAGYEIEPAEYMTDRLLEVTFTPHVLISLATIPKNCNSATSQCVLS